MFGLLKKGCAWYVNKSYEKSTANIQKALAHLQNTINERPYPSTPEMILSAQNNLLITVRLWSSLPLGDAFALCYECLKECDPSKEECVATLRVFQVAASLQGVNLYDGFPEEVIIWLKKLDAEYEGKFLIKDKNSAFLRKLTG